MNMSTVTAVQILLALCFINKSNMINLENLFELYIHNKKTLQTQKLPAEMFSCYTKYKESLPKGYIFAFPNSIVLKVTEACNLRCKHCFYAEQPEFYNKRSELNTTEIKELIDFLVDEINIIFLTLTGGEVFVRKDFLEILNYIKQKYIPVIIQTNGVLIDEIKAKQLGKTLNLKTDSVQISLEGADAESHNKIRGDGTFEKAINAIQLLRKNNIRVQINMTLTTVSAPKIENIFELCRNLNVNWLSIGRLEICSDKQRYLELPTEELMNYSNILLTKAKKINDIKMDYRALTLFDFLKLPEGKILLDNYINNKDIQISQNKCLTCHHHDKLTISSEGNVFFCSMDESKDAILGNLREQNFYDIWENRFNTPYFQKRDMSTTKCRNCKYIPLCNTGCMASAYKKYGDINCAAAECTYFNEYMRLKNG